MGILMCIELIQGVKMMSEPELSVQGEQNQEIGGTDTGRKLLGSHYCGSSFCKRRSRWCYVTCKHCKRCPKKPKTCFKEWNVGTRSNGFRAWSVTINGQNQGIVTDECCYQNRNCQLSGGKTLRCSGDRCSVDGHSYSARLGDHLISL